MISYWLLFCILLYFHVFTILYVIVIYFSIYYIYIYSFCGLSNDIMVYVDVILWYIIFLYII